MAGEAVVSAITARRYPPGPARRSPDSYDPADQLPIKETEMHWYTDVIRRYTDFDGRADRPEFWWFALINLIVSVGIWVAGIALFGLATGELLAVVYGLATLLPVLGVAIRRLHDTNKSGWWIVVDLVPFVGGIILIVLLAIAGTPGPNRFGPQPPPRRAV
jgi:uncharacterized membrane protein YhaH (DUF805 family)